MKRLLPILLLSSFGMLTTTLVAWGLAASESPRHIGIASRSMASRVGVSDRTWQDDARSPGGIAPRRIGAFHGFGVDTTVLKAPQLAPGASFDPAVTPQRALTWQRRFDIVAGWPFRSLAGARSETDLTARDALDHKRDEAAPDIAVSYIAALPVPGDALALLPLRPLWPGFLLDLLFYAGAALILALAVRAARVVRRAADRPTAPDPGV